MQPLSAEQRGFFEAAVAQYQQDLATAPTVQTYLQSRGITAEVAQRFRLGAVERPLPGHEHLRGRLAIPYLTPSGVVNINFRCAEAHRCKDFENHRKYLKTEGAASNLFNVLDLKKPSPFICIAEGEIDAITLSMCGLPAVGVAGVNAWADHFGRCLEDYEIKYSFADPDEAGSKLHKLLAKEVKARPIKIPGGADVNEHYRAHGAAGLRALIEA